MPQQHISICNVEEKSARTHVRTPGLKLGVLFQLMRYDVGLQLGLLAPAA